MIKIIGLFSWMLLSHVSMAQTAVNEASFKYDISIEGAGNNAAAKSFEGATYQVYVKGNQSRTEMINGLGTESVLYDSRAAKGAILKEYSGQKLMITMNAENWSAKNNYFRNLKFTVGNEEKTINGFACKKATAALSSGESLSVYFAPGIVLNNRQYNNAFTNIEGLPVQYEVKSGNMKFIYTLKSISYEPIAAAKFELPKSGYRIMSYEENLQLRKGGK